jgi:hypothetical protein
MKRIEPVRQSVLANGEHWERCLLWLLPANEVKVKEFTNGGEIVDVARDEVSANASRC